MKYMEEFNSAIETARNLYNKTQTDPSSVSQEEIDSAVTALNNALVSFRYAQETGIRLIFNVAVTDIHAPVFGATPNSTAACNAENVTIFSSSLTKKVPDIRKR